MTDARSRHGDGWVRVRLRDGRAAKVRVVQHPTRGRLVIVKPITGKD